MRRAVGVFFFLGLVVLGGLSLWVDDETGLPTRVELRSTTWGEASLVARSVSVPDRLHPDLFSSPR